MTGTVSKPNHRVRHMARSLVCLCLSTHSSKATASIRYLNYIVLASRRFRPYAWLQYDTQFRLKMASDPSISWSTEDPEEMATWLSADAVLNCFTCGSPEHMASACPNKDSEKSSSLRCPVCSVHGHVARNYPNLAPNNPNPNPNPNLTQLLFQTIKFANYLIEKITARCPYFHVCTKCKGGHPEQACPERT